MQQSTVLYLDDIDMTFNIIDVLKGTGPIYIANPWFSNPPSTQPFDAKDFFKIKPSKGTTQAAGVYYLTPSIYIRNKETSTFIKDPQLCLSMNKKNGVTSYAICKPFDDTIKTNMKISVRFNQDISSKIILIDWRLTLMLDIIMTAKILALDLSSLANVSSNIEFFTAFNELIKMGIQIYSKKYNKKFTKTIIYTDNFAESWIKGVVYCKVNETFYPVLSSVYETDPESIEDNIDEHGMKLVFSQLMSKCTMPGFTTSNSAFKPSNIYRSYKNKSDGVSIANSDELRFKVKMNGSKMPESLCTSHLEKHAGKLVLTTLNESMVSTLWGGSNSKLMQYDGFIIVKINIDMSIYKQGSTYIKWDVLKYYGKAKVSNSIDISVNDIPDIEDDENDDIPPVQTPVQSNIPDIDLDED